MQFLNRCYDTFYSAFHNQYISPERLEKFAKKHPYISEGLSIAASNILEGAVGCLYGKVSHVSMFSCAKILVISNIFRQMMLYGIALFVIDHSDPQQVEVFPILGTFISCGFAGVALAELNNSKLIGVAGMIAFFAYTVLKNVIQLKISYSA